MRAAELLGCDIHYLDSGQHVYLVRGAVKLFAVRRFPVSAKVQRELIATLEFSETEWVRALRESEG